MPAADTTVMSREYTAELLEAVASNRDKTAFGTLFEYYAPRVKAYLIRLGAQNEVAEELAQEVMTTAWTKASKYDRSQASVSTWLFTIARNRRIDVVRKERKSATFDTNLELHQSDVAWPDSIVDGELRDEKVRGAIADLPVDQAEVLYKGFFEGKSHTEIADELGIALGTVKSRTRLAYDRLRHALVGEVSL